MQAFKILALGIALALLLISLASVLSPTMEDFHPSNPNWNGLEEFSKITNAKSMTGGIIPEKSIIFIIGPSMSFSKSHMEALKNFVLEGGTLVIMDESGIANELLSSFGLGIYIDGHVMLDAVFYYKNWKMPKITSSDLTIGEIVLNVPSILRVNKSSVKILAYSSSFSFLDLNGDFERQRNEPIGPFPVLAKANYGNGQVIVFSDSSPFLNGVISLGDNAKLLEKLTSGKMVFINDGIWPISLPLAYRAAVLKVYAILSHPEFKIGLTFLTIALVYALVYKWKSSPVIEEVEELLKRHPDWNGALLKALKEAREKIE